jgi:putative membrane protein
MTTARFLLTGWDLEPSVIVGCAALLLAYLYFVRGRSSKQTAYFVSGVLILLLALISPLDTLSDTYLFSAHMMQHLLLMLAVPPLLLLGIPESLASRMLKRPWIAKSEHVLSRPVLAWVLAVGGMAIWHLPVFYNAALANENIHIAQHLTFLVTATIFWWLLFSPVPELRLQPATALAYLFFACMANTVVAAMITLGPVGIYPAYLAPAGDPGVLNMVRNGWGISPQLDQQIGGLLMWVPGCGVYLLVILAIVLSWLSHSEGSNAGAQLPFPSPARSLKVD